MAITGAYRETEANDLRLTEDGSSRVSQDYSIVPAGIRTTSADDTRVTEDGIIRTTFGFELPDASLQATGSVTSTINISTFGSASLAGQGSKLTAGEGTFVDQASLTATGTMVAEGLNLLLASVSMTTTGTMTSDSLRTCFGESPLSATGSKASVGLKTLFGSITAGTDTVTRITEAGDTRVTEDGLDTRTAVTAYGNVIFATMVSQGDRTIFSSVPYYKDDGSWKEFLPYVKWNGAWTGNIKIYNHTNGAWKRSY